MRIRAAVAAMCLVLAASSAVAACSSDDSTAPASTAGSDATASSSAALVAPAEFARRIGEPSVVTINVHVPRDVDIPGTDLALPYTEVMGSDRLPADRATPLAVYCRSGNMSAMAVKDLKAMGYTDVVELEGGYEAWQADGRELEPVSPTTQVTPS